MADAALPPEALDLATEALHEAGCSDASCHYAMHANAALSADRQIAQIALEAAAPALRAQGAELERERADAMKLGGMEIEVAVYRVLNALGVERAEQAARDLKELYRAGVKAGLDIALRGGKPEPEAVRAIRAEEREHLRAELAGDQTADHAPIESAYGLTCRTCVAWQDAPLADGGESEFGIAIPVQWPCPVARVLGVNGP